MALDHFRRALALGGEKGLIWNNIGAAQLHRGEIDQGIQSFRKALEGAPCRFDARLNLIRTLANAQEREAAAQAAQIPANCQFLPEQARKLEAERRALQ